MAAKWNGKGAAPSPQAAVDWMVSKGIDPSIAAGYLNVWNHKDGTTDPAGDIGNMARMEVANPQKSYAPAKAAAAAPAKTAAKTNAAVSAPTNADPNSVEPHALNAAGTGGLDANGQPLNPLSAGANSQPLLPYANAGSSALAGVQVRNATTGALQSPNYTEADSVAPLGWTPEKIAGVQRQMMNLGLYGTQQTVLGKWHPADQEAYVALLTEANISGRTADQQVQEWSIRPPTQADLAAMGIGGAKKAAVQLSNPTDIRAVAQTASQNVLGHVDTGFVDAAPAAYQAQEAAAQTATAATTAAGTGAQVTQAPSAANFLEDKLQREHPIEADANSFINTFDNFRKILGAQ